MVPLYLDGTYGRSATVVRDSYSPVPNLTSYPSAIGTHNQGYRVTNSLGSPYTGGYTYSYGTTSNSSLLTPSRYRTPSPVRYSVQPRFRSRFYHWGQKRNERTTTRFPIYGTKLPAFDPIPIIGQKMFPYFASKHWLQKLSQKTVIE